MATARLDVELRVTQAANVKKAMKGVQKEATKAEKVIRKEYKRTFTERLKGVRGILSAERRAARESNRIIKRAEAEKRRDQKRTAREMETSMVSATKRAVKEQRGILRRNAGSIAAGVGIGGAVAFRGGLSRARSITGIPTAQENIQLAKRFELGITRLATRTGLDRDRVQQQVVDATRGTTVLPETVLRGAEAVQEKIGKEALPAFFDNASAIVRISEGLDVPIENLAATTVELVRQFHIAEKDIPRALGLIAEQAEQGSIEFGDFSGSFRRVMGIFVQSMETDGIGGLREFGTLAQLLGESLDPDVARTALQKLVLDIQDTDTRGRLSKEFRRSGQTGEIPAQITDIIRKLEVANLPVSKLQTIFTEQRALLAVTTLLGATGKLDAILASNPQLGLDRADTTAAAVRGTQRGQDLMLAGEINREVIDGFEGVSEAARMLTGAFEKLAAQNLGTLQVIGVAAEAIAAVGVLALIRGKGLPGKGLIKGIGRLAKGGGRLAGRAAAGGLSAIGGLAGAGALAGAGVLAAGGVGYGVGTGANKLSELAFGKTISDGILDGLARAGLKGAMIGGEESYTGSLQANTRAMDRNTTARRNPGNPGDNGP